MEEKKAFGRVVRNTGSAYVVALDDGYAVDCRVKGNFRIKGIRTTNPVAVGDRVEVILGESDHKYITSILPRKNYIIRRASNLSKESHIMASNIDRAILVATIADPPVSTTFIDRFMATAQAYGVEAKLALNKADLWDVESRQLADEVKYLYDSLGYETLLLSCRTGEGFDRLGEIVGDGLTLLAGNSGVGKSSIINRLAPGVNLRTGEISDLHHTGRHTTTFSEIVSLPGGGEIIDIPGVRGFGVIDFAPEEVSHFFPEIFEEGKNCRFGNCSHTGAEPGCAVVAAVEDCRIARSRYSSYLSVLEEASGEEKYRKPY